MYHSDTIVKKEQVQHTMAHHLRVVNITGNTRTRFDKTSQQLRMSTVVELIKNTCPVICMMWDVNNLAQVDGITITVERVELLNV